MLTVGTGIGGAFLERGKLLKGHTYSACEVGYMHMDGSSFEESGSHTAPLRLKFFKSPHVAFCTVRTIWAITLHGAPSNRRVFPDKLAVTLESSFFKNCIDFFYCQIVLPVFDVFDRISILERTFIIGI